jgi:16S rRNA (guanine966-N2)-methyltransferase
VTARRRHEVRIIGGSWKRSKLPVPGVPGLRPTPDRVRETLFNWLGQDLTGWHVLDAFAGSGALGFEAASRGAAEVVLLEHDPAVAAGLERSRIRLGCGAMRIERGDAVAWMQRCAPACFDLILLDPPFESGLAAPALAAALPLLAQSGLLYLESRDRDARVPDIVPGSEVLRDRRAGAVRFRLLRRGQPGG